MEFIVPAMSLYVFTGLENEDELIDLLGVDPDDSWTMHEDSSVGKTDTGKLLKYIGGPNSTGVRYDSPLNGEPDAEFEDRLTALLDRVEPMAGALAGLRRIHSYPYGNMELALRMHTVVGPKYRSGLVIDAVSILRIIALGADLFVDYAFTPFDSRDGNRYRLRRLDDEQDSNA
jgi:hypothetical protein